MGSIQNWLLIWYGKDVWPLVGWWKKLKLRIMVKPMIWEYLRGQTSSYTSCFGTQMPILACFDSGGAVATFTPPKFRPLNITLSLRTSRKTLRFISATFTWKWDFLGIQNFREPVWDTGNRYSLKWQGPEYGYGSCYTLRHVPPFHIISHSFLLYSQNSQISMGISGSKNGGTVPDKAIFCGNIPLHRPKKWAIYMVGTSNQSVPEMTIEDIPMVAEGFSMTSDVLWRKTGILFGHGRFVSGPAWRSLSMLLQVIPVHRAPVGRRSLQDEDQRVLLRSWWNDMHWQKTLENGMKWTSTGLWCVK